MHSKKPRITQKKPIKETQKEIPRFKEAVENCQEKIFESARAIADDYIDSQKEIFDLFQQSNWISRLGEGNGTFWSNWMSTITKRMTETYANTTSSYVHTYLPLQDLQITWFLLIRKHLRSLHSMQKSSQRYLLTM